MDHSIFNTANIRLNAEAEDKWSAIRACGQILVDQGYVSEAYVDDMIAREKGASVYVGNNVAIPHGIANSEKNIFKSGISFLQVPKGVDFDGETAYMLIGIAGKEGTHIELLGQIAMICSDPDNIEKLKSAATEEEVYNIFEALS